MIVIREVVLDVGPPLLAHDDPVTSADPARRERAPPDPVHARIPRKRPSRANKAWHLDLPRMSLPPVNSSAGNRSQGDRGLVHYRTFSLPMPRRLFGIFFSTMFLSFLCFTPRPRNRATILPPHQDLRTVLPRSSPPSLPPPSFPSSLFTQLPRPIFQTSIVLSTSPPLNLQIVFCLGRKTTLDSSRRIDHTGTWTNDHIVHGAGPTASAPSCFAVLSQFGSQPLGETAMLAAVPLPLEFAPRLPPGAFAMPRITRKKEIKPPKKRVATKCLLF